MQRFDDPTLARLERSVHTTERLTPRKHQPFGPEAGLGSFQLVRGKIGSAYTGLTGTLRLTDVVPLGEWSAYPGSEIIVVNVNKTSGSAGTAYAIYHYAVQYPGTGTGAGTSPGTGTGDANWELFVIPSGPVGAEGVFGCIFKDIPAASMSITGEGTSLSLSLTHGYGTEAATLLEQNGATWRETRNPLTDETVLIDVANFAKSMLRASIDEPIILQGAVYYLTTGTDTEMPGTEPTGTGEPPAPTPVFVPGNWDIRSLYNLNVNADQIPFKPQGSVAFELGGEPCGTGTGTGT